MDASWAGSPANFGSNTNFGLQRNLTDGQYNINGGSYLNNKNIGMFPYASSGGPYPFNPIPGMQGPGAESDPSMNAYLLGTHQFGTGIAQNHDTFLSALEKNISAIVINNMYLFGSVYGGFYWLEFIPLVRTPQRIMQAHSLFFPHQGSAELAPEESVPKIFGFLEEAYMSRTHRRQVAFKFNLEAAKYSGLVGREVMGLIMLCLQTKAFTRETTVIGGLLAACNKCQQMIFSNVRNLEVIVNTLRNGNEFVAVFQKGESKNVFPRVTGELAKQGALLNAAPADIGIMPAACWDHLDMKGTSESFMQDGVVRRTNPTLRGGTVGSIMSKVAIYLANIYNDYTKNGMNIDYPRRSNAVYTDTTGFSIYLTSRNAIMSGTYALNPLEGVMAFATHNVLGGIPSEYESGRTYDRKLDSKSYNSIQIEDETQNGNMVEVTMKSCLQNNHMFNEDGYLNVEAVPSRYDEATSLLIGGTTFKKYKDDYGGTDKKKPTLGLIKCRNIHFDLMQKTIDDSGKKLRDLGVTFLNDDTTNPRDILFTRANLIKLVNAGIYIPLRVLLVRPLRKYIVGGYMQLVSGGATAVYNVNREDARIDANFSTEIALVIYRELSGLFVLNFQNIQYMPAVCVLKSVSGSGTQMMSHENGLSMNSDASALAGDIMPIIIPPDCTPHGEYLQLLPHLLNKELEGVTVDDLTAKILNWRGVGMADGGVDTLPIAVGAFLLDRIVSPYGGRLIAPLDNANHASTRLLAHAAPYSFSGTALYYDTAGLPKLLSMGSWALAEYDGYGSTAERNNLRPWVKKMTLENPKYQPHSMIRIDASELGQ